MGYYGPDVQLAAELIMELSVNIAPPIVVGETHKGYLKVIPITGGSFRGQELRGEIVPGGADWNTAMGSSPEDPAGIRQIFAKYTIRTQDGIVISVENEGWKSIDPANATTIATVPKFQTSSPRYHWLNYGVYVGSLTPRPNGNGVELKFYRLK